MSLNYTKTLELYHLIAETLDLAETDHVPLDQWNLKGVDSLQMAEMIQVLESKALASISFEKALECETVGELALLAERAGWGVEELESNEHMRADS